MGSVGHPVERGREKLRIDLIWPETILDRVKNMFWKGIAPSALLARATERTQRPAPLAPGPFVGLARVGGAPNDGGKRVFPIRHLDRVAAAVGPTTCYI